MRRGLEPTRAARMTTVQFIADANVISYIYRKVTAGPCLQGFDRRPERGELRCTLSRSSEPARGLFGRWG